MKNGTQEFSCVPLVLAPKQLNSGGVKAAEIRRFYPTSSYCLGTSEQGGIFANLLP